MSAAPFGRFDLYDFFSVLLPGIALLLSLYPLFPRRLSVSGVWAVLPLLAGGFVIGRAVHAGAIRIENWIDTDSHRNQFVHEINSPTILNEEMVDQFYDDCRDTFGNIGLGCGRDDFDTNGDETSTALYTAVRSHVHIDSRGRSRTFQAVYAFYRSMWFVSIMLAGIYIAYGIGGLVPTTSSPYEPKIALLTIPPAWFVIGSIALFTGGYTTFRDAKSKYRKLFVQYLIADFIALRNG